MLCTEEKLALLQAHSADLVQRLQLWSPRDLDRVKGRFLHYSQAIRHLRIRVTEMQHLMGPVALGQAYDSPGPLPTGLAELAAEMGEVVGRFGSVGTPLWPAVASSASSYSFLLSGEERRLFCSLTWHRLGVPGPLVVLGRAGTSRSFATCCWSVHGPPVGTSPSNRFARRWAAC
jgi:hypothetical protein